MSLMSSLGLAPRSPREKRILVLGAIVAAAFLLTTAVPAARDLYQQRTIVLDGLRMEIEREQRLAEDEDTWRQRRDEIEARATDMETQVFGSATVPLLSASIQRLVREHAGASDINITATRLAESLQADGWLLVEQSVSFNLGDQGNLPGFIERLEQSRPWLGVSSFSIRHNRNQYTGDITVVGFARTMALQEGLVP